jgi:hypothetical protein
MSRDVQNTPTARTLLGGHPLTVTARTTNAVQVREQSARVERLCSAHSRLVEEFRVDPHGRDRSPGWLRG